jgi:hypothetical protein
VLFNIKARLISLGYKVKDLIPELQKRGMLKVMPCELSRALNGYDKTPKAEKIVSLSNEIVTEWENQHRTLKRISK